MIAIYARQSLDKKDSISIDTQIDFCKREIVDNSEYKVYQDKGFSGKNIDRPAFSSLMQAVENKQISKIIVYRLDRISRSITDFANIIDILESNKVDFVSANEKFDTSSPVGRAMLYIIMVFAQLERETIAERIRDNYYERGKTGVWLGGPAPLGYKNIKIISNGKKITVLKSTEDIETIKEVYEMYANSNKSLGGIAKIMLEKHNVMWNNIKLSRILHNPAYVKADVDIFNYFRAQKCIIVNDIEDFTGEKGCSLYGKRDRGVNKYRSLNEQVLAIARHDGVIDSQTWLKCQYKLEKNVQIKNTGKGRHTWLTGLVKCGYCGYGMNVKVYKDKKYFNCTGKYTTNLCIEKLETHHVRDIEDYITQQIKSYSLELKNRASKSDATNDLEVNKLKMELHNIETQLGNLLDSLATANNVLMDYVNRKVVELDEKKNKILEAINKKAVRELRIELPDMTRWETFTDDLKKELANKLISKINVTNNKIEVVWKC